nr:MAG TPA: helix-turn-helix domain protein [Caudoviricetes sp.]
MPSNKEDKQLLNTKIVSEILLVTPAHVRELIKAGNFPNAVRPGKGYLIPRSDLNAYILRRESERR